VYPKRVSLATRKTRPFLNLSASLGRYGDLVLLAGRSVTSTEFVGDYLGFEKRQLNPLLRNGDPPSKIGYRRATGEYMLRSRFTFHDPKLPSAVLDLWLRRVEAV